MTITTPTTNLIPADYEAAYDSHGELTGYFGPEEEEHDMVIRPMIDDEGLWHFIEFVRDEPLTTMELREIIGRLEEVVKQAEFIEATTHQALMDAIAQIDTTKFNMSDLGNMADKFNVRPSIIVRVLDADLDEGRLVEKP